MSKQLSKAAKAHIELEELKHLRDQIDPLPPGDLRDVLERKFDARWDALNLLLCPELPAKMMEEIKALPRFSPTAPRISHDFGRAAARAAFSDPDSMQMTPRTRIKWKMLEDDPKSVNPNYVIRELLQHAYELEEDLTLLRSRS